MSPIIANSQMSRHSAGSLINPAEHPGNLRLGPRGLSLYLPGNVLEVEPDGPGHRARRNVVRSAESREKIVQRRTYWSD